ncbi:hypothetical protein [Dactylosporangium sp. CA-139066]|uniref:hypothetical protein n=1 Tax=Dactylosporangium sp. CA-139066 TaxID=3239930 RepID=UPI003D8A7BFA
MDEERFPAGTGGEVLEGEVVGADGGAAKPTAGAAESIGAGCATVLAVPVVIALIVGLFMVICTGGSAGPGHSGIGIGLLVFGIPVVAVCIAVVLFDPAPGRRRRVALLGFVVLPVVFVALTAGLAGLGGQAVRWIDPADYTGAYGTRVTASLPDKCANDTHVYTSGAKGADADIVCEHATWALGGAQHEGTVVIGWHDVELPTGISVPESVEAYVIGDKGYSVSRVGRVENVARWGGVPLWWLTGLPVAILGFFLLARSGWAVAKPKQRG